MMALDGDEWEMLGVTGTFFVLFVFGMIGAYCIFEEEKVPMSYEVIEAESPEDAMDKSMWSPGDLARCVKMNVSSNSKGTYSVFPEFEKLEIGDLEVGEEE